MDSDGACSSPLYSFIGKKELLRSPIKKEDPADEAVGARDPSPIKSFDLGKKGDIDRTPAELIMAGAARFPPGAPRVMKSEFTKFKRSSRRKTLFFDTRYDDEFKELIAATAEYTRRQLMAGLPELFDSLLDIFQRRKSMTKEKLVDNISARHMVKPIEEELSLMLELAPEWIQEKRGSSICDLVIYVNKIPSQSQSAQDYWKLNKFDTFSFGSIWNLKGVDLFHVFLSG